jgi:hypothetical protein
MPAADNVEGWGLSSGRRAFFLFVLAVLQDLVVCRLFEELTAPRWTFACLAVPLTGVLPTGLPGLATRAIRTRKTLRWVIVLLVNVLGVAIFKLLQHSRTKERFLDFVHRRLMGRNLYLLDSAPSVWV